MLVENELSLHLCVKLNSIKAGHVRIILRGTSAAARTGVNVGELITDYLQEME